MKTATEITLARAREEWEAPLRAEIDALRHDIERHIAIATEQANRIADLEADLGEWQPIATLPSEGQALATDDDPVECLDGRYGTIELIVCPMLADGRTLNQNSGNYTSAGAWKWWRPVPPVRFAKST
jgi:hypothetical protein